MSGVHSDDAIDNLRQKVKAADDSIHDALVMVDTFSTQLKDINCMNEKLKESDQKISRLQTWLEESESARAMQRNKIQILQMELERLKASNEDIMKYKDLKIQHLENDAIQQKQKIKTLENLFENQRSMFPETTKLRTELENSQRNLTIAKSQLSQNQREKREQIMVSERKIKDLEDEIIETQARHDKTIRSLREVETVQSESSKELQKENETLRKAVNEMEEQLRKLKHDYEEKYKQREKKIKDLEDEITELQARHEKTITNEREVATVQSESSKELQEENETLRKAVNEMEKQLRKLKHDFAEKYNQRENNTTGRRLTGNDPDIADLSDINRPTKLAEKYAELLDNEWTDAYSYLENLDAYKGPETIVIAALMLMLTMAYKISLETAEKQLEALRNNLNDFHGNIPTQDQQVKDILKQLKDQRKRVVHPSEALTAIYRKQIEQAFPKLESSIFESSALKPYVQKCLQLCWLMVIQDPPVHLELEGTKKREAFDKNKFKEYTQAGPFIMYTVWPAVFLEKDGPLLCKGVVQCTKTFSGSCHAPARKIDVDVNRKSSSVRETGDKPLTIPAKMTEKGHSEKRNSQTAKNTDNTDDQTQKKKSYFTEKL